MAAADSRVTILTLIKTAQTKNVLAAWRSTSRLSKLISSATGTTARIEFAITPSASTGSSYATQAKDAESESERIMHGVQRIQRHTNVAIATTKGHYTLLAKALQRGLLVI